MILEKERKPSQLMGTAELLANAYVFHPQPYPLWAVLANFDEKHMYLERVIGWSEIQTSGKEGTWVPVTFDGHPEASCAQSHFGSDSAYPVGLYDTREEANAFMKRFLAADFDYDTLAAELTGWME